MKKLATVLAAAMLISGAAFAQDFGGFPGEGFQGGPRPQGGQRPDQISTTELAQSRTDKMAEKYGLDAKQTKKVFKLNKKFFESMQDNNEGGHMGGPGMGMGPGGPGMGGPGMGPGGMGPGMGGGRPMGQRPDGVSSSDSKRPELTDEQKAEMKAKMEARRAEMEAQMEENQAAKEKYEAKLQKILTPDQYSAYVKDEMDAQLHRQQGPKGPRPDGQRPDGPRPDQKAETK